MTDLGRHRHTRQAALFDPEQDHASSLHPEGKIGAAPRGAVGPASAGGLGLDGPPAARRAIGTGACRIGPRSAWDLANAVANNGPGQGRTTVELPSRHGPRQRAVWTRTAGSGRT
jgi:hypothetical protein